MTLPNFNPGCKPGLEKIVTSAHAFTGSFHDDEKSQKTHKGLLRDLEKGEGVLWWKKERVFWARTANMHCSATVAALKCELTWGPSQGCRELLTTVIPF